MRNNTLKRLDNVFSRYIRLRDADENGMVTCISCGKRVKWDECDAGHFVDRANMSTRFNVENVNAQCYECNRLFYGNKSFYRFGIDMKYGKGTAEKLESLKNHQLKLSDAEANDLIAHYMTEIIRLREQKHL